MELVVPHLHLNHHNHYVMCASFHLKKDLVICILKTNGVNMGHWNFTEKCKAPFENLLCLTQMNVFFFWRWGCCGEVCIQKGHD